MNAIIFGIAFSVIIFGLVKMIFELTGINKSHNIAMERIHMNFIKNMQDIHNIGATYNVPGLEPTVVTYLIPCWPGIFNKLRGKVKLCLWKHEYNVTKPETDKSRQFLVVSKEALFYMQLKGYIETKNRKNAVKAIRYLKEVVSLP